MKVVPHEPFDPLELIPLLIIWTSCVNYITLLWNKVEDKPRVFTPRDLFDILDLSYDL